MRSGWIGVAAGLAFMAAMPVGAQQEFMAQTPRQTVPSVMGMTLVQARQALDAKSLRLGGVTSVVKNATGLVITDQNPRAGDVVATGTPVDVTLSQPQQPKQPAAGTPGYTGQPQQRIVTVPNVTGSNLVEATVVLAVYSLQLGPVTGQMKSPDAQKIIYQNPQQGARVPAGTLVAVTLDQPQKLPPQKQLPQVPNLIGLTLPDAANTLTQNGLQLGAVVGAAKSKVPLKIVAQTLPQGIRVPAGTSVSVTLETLQQPPPPQGTLVPDVVNETVDEARAKLQTFSLQLGTVTGQRESPVPLKIVSQSPQPGPTRVPLGTAVAVTLQTPPPPPIEVKVPNLMGKTVDEAAAALAQRSLQLGAVQGQAEGSARWKIVAQTLPAESSVVPGTAVGVTVEKPAETPVAVTGSTTPTSTTDTSRGSTTSTGHTWLWAGAGIGLVLLGVGAGRFIRPKIPASVAGSSTPTAATPAAVVTMLAEPNVAQTRTAVHVAPKIRLVVQLRGLPSPGAYDVRREASIVTREDSRT